MEKEKEEKLLIKLLSYIYCFLFLFRKINIFACMFIFKNYDYYDYYYFFLCDQLVSKVKHPFHSKSVKEKKRMHLGCCIQVGKFVLCIKKK